MQWNTAQDLELRILVVTRRLFIADRYCNGASLLESLHSQRTGYVIRTDQHTPIHTAHGRQVVRHLPLDRKRQLSLGLVYYHFQRKIPANLLVCQKQNLRWNLASSLHDPNTTHQARRSRMHIEDMFQDLKQHLAMQRLSCHSLDRHATWLLLVAIAYSYLYSLGQLP